MPDNQPKAAQPAQRAAAPAKERAVTHYKVLHGAVGQWEQGAVISSDDLRDIDVDRLLRLGAIEPAQEPIKDVPPADDEH